MAQATRVEHGLVGDNEVPADAYCGVHTARAVENFAITASTTARFPGLTSLVAVKLAAARANRDPGPLPSGTAQAISGACEEIRPDGRTIPEVVSQGAFEVIGNDLTVTMAAEAGLLSGDLGPGVDFARRPHPHGRSEVRPAVRVRSGRSAGTRVAGSEAAVLVEL